MSRLGRTLIPVLLVVAVAAIVAVHLQQRVVVAWNPRNLVRLHVVAHSDDPVDQDAKLAVRDAVVGHFSGRIEPGSRSQALLTVGGELHQVETVAREALLQNGLDYGVRVEWGTFPFPARTYGELTVAEGDYQSLRVVLGAGNGDNWWCVLFPPLCLVDLTVGEGEQLTLDDEDLPLEMRFWVLDQIRGRWPAASRWFDGLDRLSRRD